MTDRAGPKMSDADYVASITGGKRSPLGELYERLSKKLEQGRAIHLSSSDLDWLVVSGAYARIVQAAAEEHFEAARARIEKRGGDLSFLRARLPEAEGEDLAAPDFPPPMAKKPVDVFSPATLARHWGVSATSVYSLIKSGALPNFKLGTLYRIRRADVELYEREHEYLPPAGSNPRASKRT